MHRNCQFATGTVKVAEHVRRRCEKSYKEEK